MARIPPTDLNCAFYLYPSEDTARAGVGLGGSGFWVSVQSMVIPEFWWLYAVSNRHVVHSHGASVIRANQKHGGRRIINSEPTDWVEHPNGHDIAVMQMHQPHTEGVELVSVVTGMFVEQHDVNIGRVAVGDEVYMIGRFVNHEGRARNTPSARFGNISMLPDEPIYIDSKTRPQESFAVELRSACGYSGSPVFVSLEHPVRNYPGGPIHLPLGVHWGHIVEPWTVETKIVKKVMEAGLAPDERQVDQVSANTGMNGVVPAWRLKELLDLPQFKDVREADEKAELERLKANDPSDQASGKT